MNKQTLPAEIGKLFSLLYDGEGELLARIAQENLRRGQSYPPVVPEQTSDSSAEESETPSR